jgi:hypothetical protein
MTIKEVKESVRIFERPSKQQSEWLISEYDRLAATNAVMERALAWIAEEANTGESGDAYVMKEEALQTLAAIQATRPK